MLYLLGTLHFKGMDITMGKNKKQISIDSEKLGVKERSDIPDQFYSSELQA